MVTSEQAVVLGAHAWDLALILLIAAATARAHRLTGAPSLRRFALGFALLGLAQVAALSLYALGLRGGPIEPDQFDHYDALFWTYYLSTAFGLAFVFWSFGRRPFKWTPALAPVLLVGGLLMQLLVLIELFFVVLHSGLNHIARARAGSLQTALGFFFLLLGHFLFFLQEYTPLTPRNAWGEAPTALGFLLLYLAIVRPRWTA